MSTASTLMCVFGAASALSALLVPVAVISALRFRRNSATAVGTVTRIEDCVVNEDRVAHIRYEVGGAPHYLSVRTNGGYAVGEPVRLRYPIGEPGRSVVDERAHVWMETITAATLAVLFGLVAGLFAVLGH
jgi:hypothetical protein